MSSVPFMDINDEKFQFIKDEKHQDCSVNSMLLKLIFLFNHKACKAKFSRDSSSHMSCQFKDPPPL